MVPIVEPEVLMDGNHDIKKCYEVTTAVLNECFNQLVVHKVNLKGIVLKPNMILNGSESGKKNKTENWKKDFDSAIFSKPHHIAILNLNRIELAMRLILTR